MTELQVWVLLVGVLLLSAGWLVFVAWLRYQALRQRRQPTRVEIADLGAQPPAPGDNPDWREAQREAAMMAANRVRRQNRQAALDDA